ncbi:hypothetical protein Mgra_00000390 [Meloidogyne graminicola]|uniref:Uncharacterized protein n=1 Tax=Meloidogyne graminicola TaxID=189291 RepID=A0A8T0A3G8_9BILA|nr:hypothetical protein Mgra_00000390 [Meloidogyne graminicola]
MFNFYSKNALRFTRNFTSSQPSFSSASDGHNKHNKSQKEPTKLVHKNTSIIRSEDREIQQFVKRSVKINPRDKFGSLNKKIRMPQTEKVKTEFQPDVWDKGIEVIRYVKEREKTFREKLDDDFSEGRAVQVEEPLYVTFKHALRKDLKIKRLRAERKRDAEEESSS